MSNRYTQMQQTQYDNDASKWTVEERDYVVGNFDAHNAWTDYDDYLFKDLVKKKSSCILLDFACGPGRNLVRYNDEFKRLDGVDISQINLDNAKKWIEYNNKKLGNLILCNGVDLNSIKDNSYDVLMSTIAMQHICVHEIRFKYLEEFYRVLKKDGLLTIQMGFGTNHPRTVGYYENFYDAPGTNSMCDVRIESVDQIKSDLEVIGFRDFNHYIRPVGPGDGHTNWIFFNAKK